MTPKYPEVCVKLIGEDGNAFAIISRIRVALRHYGVRKEEIDYFTSEATGGNYDHLLATCMKWVEVY